MVPEHCSLTDTSHISGRVRSGYFLTAIYPMAAPDWQNTAGEGYMTVVNGLTITTVLAWTCFHFLQISPISPAGSIFYPPRKLFTLIPLLKFLIASLPFLFLAIIILLFFQRKWSPSTTEPLHQSLTSQNLCSHFRVRLPAY